jgi:MFS family permease
LASEDPRHRCRRRDLLALLPGLRARRGRRAGPGAALWLAIGVRRRNCPLAQYQIFGAVAIATLGWLWGVGDTYIAELFPTVLRGTGFGIAVGGGRVVSIAAPTVIGWAIMHYGLQTPYLALAGLWVLTLIGYLLGPETKGKELEDLTDEALTEDLVPVTN